MKRRLILAATALGLAGCSQPTGPVVSASLAAASQSRLLFSASCASVWDISVDGRDSGPLLFMSTSEHYDVATAGGAHYWSATRWAPSDVASQAGSVAATGDAKVTLHC